MERSTEERYFWGLSVKFVCPKKLDVLSISGMKFTFGPSVSEPRVAACQKQATLQCAVYVERAHERGRWLDAGRAVYLFVNANTRPAVKVLESGRKTCLSLPPSL